MKPDNLRFAAMTALAVMALDAGQANAQDAPPVVQTASGAIQGTTRDGLHVFTGIPFAAPPVGPLRFRPPQPVAKWNGTLVADKAPPSCIQFSGGPARGAQSEDCLYLNLWAPQGASKAKPLPVMVWIFGGGLVGGGIQGVNGAELAKNGGVLVVALNYRLGVFGMMMDASLDEKDSLSGNYLIRDQQAALRWVQANIAAFGGDPNNVTLFGQSSGASSVLLQIVSPSAKGLFQKAIAESSGGGTVYKREIVQAGVAKTVIKAVGCTDRPDTAACLRSAPVSAFVDAKIPMEASGEDAWDALGLVVDPKLLPMNTFDAFAAGQFNHVPVLDGNNVNEGAAFVAGTERQLGHPLTESELPAAGRKEYFGVGTAKVLAQYPTSKYPAPDIALMNAVTDFRQSCPTDETRRALSRYVPVYAYEVTEPDPAQAPPDKATTNIPNTPRHGTELTYIFGARNAPLTGRAAALSARFQRYWSNFAKFSTPDPAGREWPRFTDQNPVVISLEEPPKLTTDFAARHNCAFMDQPDLLKLQRVETPTKG